ncbi:MAG: class I SAM-dependent methyltransferase [Limnospira sp. PMC 1279.21]|uniref:class I SAM-dependent methyltransferase n=1 Tax=Limnospira sp. PMC 1279.21 TaxID=2981062 RepID=UPI0028E11DEB|nr:class I SAM-dependent methyltransferase [Limnospira sp. PMC 1279.21]MDT9225495.1 class I SAM-dependent methyltransferase [Limnospira sp. PMC 1279.21]
MAHKSTNISSRVTPIKRVYIRGCPRSGNTLILYMCRAGFKNSHILEEQEIPVKEKSFADKVTFGTFPSPHTSPHRKIWAEHFLDDEDAGIIFMLRDPRDVLLSDHGLKPGQPWIGDPQRWIDNAVLLQKLESHPRVIPVKFEELLTKPNEVQEKIAKAFGLEIGVPFSECWKHFAMPTLNNLQSLKGIRPLDSTRIGNWKGDNEKSNYVTNKLQAQSKIFALMDHFGYDTSTSEFIKENADLKRTIPFYNDLISQLYVENPYNDFNFKEYPIDLQGWNGKHKVFAQTISTIKPKIIIEVGVWKGQATIHMAEIATKVDPEVIVISIDTWLGSPEHWNPKRPDKIFWSLKLKHGYPGLYYQFLANVMWKGLENNILPLPQTSTNAAIILKRLGIKADMIHIDAGHDFENVYSDLVNYWDLLTEGGVLIGDDFTWEGVKRAAEHFCSERNLKLVEDSPKYIISKDNSI